MDKERFGSLTDSGLRCPYCLQLSFANTVSPIECDTVKIGAGSHTVCSECFHVIVFDYGLLLRKPDPKRDKHAWEIESKMAKFGERFGEPNYKGTKP